MHTIKYIVFGLGLLLFMSSCETDFDTTADWEDITVVYGIIDQNDSIQYIVIKKAFLGEGNVLEYAQEYDSSNYLFNMKVWLEEFDADDGHLVQTIEFDTTTSYIPENPYAIFPTGAQTIYDGGPQEVYEIKFIISPPFDTIGYRKLWLNDQNTYTLNILYPDSSKFISSSTQLVQDFFITRPVPGSTTIRFVPYPAVPSVFAWKKPDNDEGKFKYELLVKFNYQELTFDDVLINKTIDLVPNVNVYPPLSGSEVYYYYWDNNFYSSCENDIPYDDPDEEATIKERYTGNIDTYISVAGEAFSQFMEIYEPSTSIVQDKPTYSNIENGIGVFSSRYQINESKRLDDQTKAVLKNYEDLKFVR